MESKNTISKGPKKRDPTCYQVLQDIVIPAGTILRQEGAITGLVECGVAGGTFSIRRSLEAEATGIFKKVIA